MTPQDYARRGAAIAREVLLASALRKRFGTPLNMLRQLGMDERTANELLTSTESEMPRYRTGADRRRATDGRRFRNMIGDEDVVDAIQSLMSELSEEEAEELLDRLGSDRRRRADDEPEPFPGRPRPGGGMDPITDARRRARDEVDPLARWRQPGEDRRHAADRRALAHDEMADMHKYGQKAFFERFPSAAKIRLAP